MGERSESIWPEDSKQNYSYGTHIENCEKGFSFWKEI
jgi:hypothetical protein